jgi:hypothetical protein
MWVSKLHYESMFENLTRARQETSDLKARLASMQATQDWLTSHVNRLEHERQILVQARLGLSMPMPIIERQEPGVETPPGTDPGSVHGMPDESVAFSQMLASGLDDVGDDQAARMGIGHDAQGMLVYKQ